MWLVDPPFGHLASFTSTADSSPCVARSTITTGGALSQKGRERGGERKGVGEGKGERERKGEGVRERGREGGVTERERKGRGEEKG